MKEVHDVCSNARNARSKHAFCKRAFRVRSFRIFIDCIISQLFNKGRSFCLVVKDTAAVRKRKKAAVVLNAVLKEHFDYLVVKLAGFVIIKQLCIK